MRKAALSVAFVWAIASFTTVRAQVLEAQLILGDPPEINSPQNAEYVGQVQTPTDSPAGSTQAENEVSLQEQEEDPLKAKNKSSQSSNSSEDILGPADGGSLAGQSSNSTMAAASQPVQPLSLEMQKPSLSIPSECIRPGDIALTFDDGPGLYTKDLLDVLDAAGINATFHVSAGMLSNGNRDKLIRQAFESGHNIGIRLDPSITARALEAMSLEEFEQKLISESEAIYTVIGRYPRFIRMPWGYRYGNTKSFARLLFRMGFIVTGWTLDAHDYRDQMTSETIMKNVYEPIVAASKRAGGKLDRSFIVLQRDLFDISSEVEEGIALVTDMQDANVRFVTLGECFGTTRVYKTDAAGSRRYYRLEAAKP